MNGDMGMNGDQILPINPQADEWLMNQAVELFFFVPYANHM